MDFYEPCKPGRYPAVDVAYKRHTYRYFIGALPCSRRTGVLTVCPTTSVPKPRVALQQRPLEIE